MKRPLIMSNSPNIENDDISLYLKLIFSFGSYKEGIYENKLREWFKSYFNILYVNFFISGRLALYEILKALELKPNSEVIIQSFTCSVVPEAIIALSLKPIFVDINNNFNLDIDSLIKKITFKTKVIVVQHTFGIPANIDEIKKIANEKNIFLIEDCAHVIGGTYNNKLLGTFADAAFFSFGRSKAFSATNGGVVITNNKALGEKLKILENNTSYPSYFLIFRELLHPLVFYFLVNPFYDIFGIGKLILIGFQKLNILTKEVSKNEKIGKFDFSNVYRLPNIFCYLASHQLEKIEKFNNLRKNAVNFYLENLKLDYNLDKKLYNNPLLRFPILVKNRNEIIRKAKKENIYLDKWYSNIVDPKGVSLKEISYLNDNLNVKEIVSKILNLPTYPLLKKDDLKRIVIFLKKNL